MKYSFLKYSKEIILAFIILSILSSCNAKEEVTSEESHSEEEGIEFTQAQFDQEGIIIGQAERRTIGSGLQVNGIIDVPPQSKISVNMPYGGFIKFIDMLPGTKVKKGQLLVTIENPDFLEFQQQYLESLARQEYLKTEFERQGELFKENVASGKAYQKAKSDYLANEARLTTMEARLNLIGFKPDKIREGSVTAAVNIYAPVNGAVREVHTNMGGYIGPEDVIMDITNSEDLHVELTVYDNDIPSVKEGQSIRFSLANKPEEWLEAEVFLVGSGVREDRSVTVHGHLKRAYKNLLPGMYVSAEIETGSKEVWAVPEESVVRFDGKNYVFAYGGEKTEAGITVHDFEMLEVMKGNTEDAYTEIVLKASQKTLDSLPLVSKGAFTVLAKAKNSEEEGGHGH